MRIAEISAFSQYSVGKIMRDIQNGVLKNQKDECRIFYARGPKSNNENIVKIGNDFKIKINALLARIFDNDGFCLFSCTNRLIKKLDEYKPDVIHIHCLHGYYMNVKKLFNYFSKHPNIKIIWTMHDTWAITGHCCFFNRIKCEKWKKGCNNCALKGDYPKSVFIDNSKKNYACKRRIFTSLSKNQLRIVTPSNWLKEIISFSFLNKYDCDVIYNGINTDIFNTNSISSDLVKEKKIILGVASVWDDRKGINTFFELSKILPDDWKIILIGKTNCEYNYPSNITHIERTSNQEKLKEYYYSADVLLNPSIDDNYPTINLEAQACGCRVLCYDVGGCKETNCGNLNILENNDVNYIFKTILEIVNQDLKKIDTLKLKQNRMIDEYIMEFKK